MNNCGEYMELISAYADGELSESDKLLTEEHLSVCENCASILEIYRGVRIAVDESSQNAPESLCVKVMERVKNDNTALIAEKMKKLKTVNMILTRYLPMAACLAFLLLTVPRLIGIGRYNSAPGAGGVSISASTQDMDSGASGAPEQRVGLFPESLIDEESDNYSRGEVSPASGMVPEEAPAPSMTPAPQPAPMPSGAAAMPQEAVPPPDIALNEIGGVESDGDDALRGEYGPIAADEPSASLLPPQGVSIDPEMVEPESEGVSQDVYAVIVVTGELPLLLYDYGFEGSAESGEFVIEITRDEAEVLIESLTGQEGVEITISNENGAFAMVYYYP